MSRSRTRPTREETRQRLFAAAATLFETKGIGATTIDAIVSKAGFTRGAFYSNYPGKDDLIVAMLEDHAEKSLAHYRRLLSEHRTSADYVSAMLSAERSDDDPLGHSPLLHMEMILYAARSGVRRAELARHLQAGRDSIVEMVAKTTAVRELDPGWAGAMLLAMQDGFRLHELIDPASTPSDSFYRAVAELQRLIERNDDGT
jgi:AcrR family transcriptional regulator